MPGGDNEPKTSPRRIATALRRAQALEMRAQAKPFSEIAAQLKYCSPAAAAQDVQRALLLAITEPAAEVRALELLRLDELWVKAAQVLNRQHVSVSHGRIVKADDGEPLLDDAPVLAAIDRMLKIQERRARLLGLDAPTKVEVLTIDAIDAAIRDAEAELARRAAAAEALQVAGPEEADL
jgi:hypothetical protein